MFLSSLQTYIRTILYYVPWWHWVVIGLLSLVVMVAVSTQKRSSVYRMIALGLTIFTGLFLFDVAVFIRVLGIIPHGFGQGVVIKVGGLLHIKYTKWVEIFSNFAIFVPFGFFLSVFLFDFPSKWLNNRHKIGHVLLTGACLSLCIECLQLILHVGFFELTDLVMNIAGTFIGTIMALVVEMLHTRLMKEGQIY